MKILDKDVTLHSPISAVVNYYFLQLVTVIKTENYSLKDHLKTVIHAIIVYAVIARVHPVSSPAGVKSCCTSLNWNTEERTHYSCFILTVLAPTLS